MKKLIIYYLVSFFCLPLLLSAQKKKTPPPPDWNTLMQQPNAKYDTIKAQVLDYFKVYPPPKNEFDKETEGNPLSFTNFHRWENFWSTRVAYNNSEKNGLFTNLTEAYSSLAQNPMCISSDLSAWQLLGPTAMTNQNMGLVTLVKQDPANASILYAGTENAGLWKSFDGGVNWTCITDVLRYPGMGVSDVAIVQNSPNIIYIGTALNYQGTQFGAGVFKSADGGATWAQTGLAFIPTDGTAIRLIRIDPTNSNIVYAMTYQKLYQSTDGGTTWPNVFILSNYYTTNNWPGIYLENFEILPGNSNVLFLTSTDPGGTNGGGKMWQLSNSGLTLSNTLSPPSSSSFKMAVTPATPNRVYILYANSSSNFYISYYTYGGTWSSLPVNTQYGASVFAISPTDENVMYLGQGQGVLYKSTTGGSSPSLLTVYNGFYSGAWTHADIRAITIVNGSTVGTGGANDKLFVGDDGGILGSVNGGNFWSNLNGTGLAITKFYGLANSDATPDIFFGGAQDNGAYTYTNGNWIENNVGDAYDGEIDKVRPNYMYITANPGANCIYRSANSGVSWFIMNQPPGSSLLTRPIQMNPIDNKLYTGYHDVFECANPRSGNPAWAALSNFTANFQCPANQVIRGLAVAPSDPNVIYASLDQVGVYATYPLFYRTLDHGANWTNIGGSILTGTLYWFKITDIVVDPYNPLRLWVTIDGINGGGPGTGKIYYSGDGGVTWLDYSAGLPNIPMNTIVYEKGSNDGLYVGTDAGVYYRNGNMSQWVCFSYSLPTCIVSDLEINYAKNTIRAATHGRGIWESHLACPSNIDLTLSGLTSSSAFNEVQHTIYSTQIITGGTVIYRAGHSVELNPGFSASTNSYFKAYIHPCDAIGNSFRSVKSFYSAENKNEATESIVIKNDILKVYPNPNEGQFTVELDDNKNTNILIFNTYGTLVKKYLNVHSNKFVVNLTGISKGLYIVKAIQGMNVKTTKIICR